MEIETRNDNDEKVKLYETFTVSDRKEVTTGKWAYQLEDENSVLYSGGDWFEESKLTFVY
jgi:hypothetical protein